MKLPAAALLILLLLFGFLTASTFYFYNQSREVATTKKSGLTSFNGEVQTLSSNTTNPEAIAETKPADSKGRVSYPANVYTVQPKETLFAIGSKFGMSWQLLTKANGITNENSVQAGSALAVPIVNKETDYYRINYVVSEDKATQVNAELRSVDNDERYDPTIVAKKGSVPFFGLSIEDSYDLLERDNSKGTAVVEVKKGDNETILIGLIQPKVKGDKGFWTVVYIEFQNES